jgi:WD40 repeat protein
MKKLVIYLAAIFFSQFLEAQEMPLLSIHPIDKDLEYLNRVEISHDGTRILSGGTIPALWDSSSGELLKTFPLITSPGIAQSITFSNDGEFVLIGDYLCRAQLWSCNTGKNLHTFTSYSFDNHSIPISEAGSITSASFSNDGKFLLTGDSNGAIQLWDMKTFNEIRRYKNLGFVQKLFFLNDQSRFIVLGSSSFEIINLYTGDTIVAMRSSNIIVSQDMMKLINYRDDSPDLLELWNLDTLTEIVQLNVKYMNLAFFPDSSKLFAYTNVDNGSHYSRLIYDLNSLNNIQSKEYTVSNVKNAPDSESINIKFFPNEDRYLTVNGNMIYIFDIKDLVSEVTNSKQY